VLRRATAAGDGAEAAYLADLDAAETAAFKATLRRLIAPPA
jgi:hypothetical protein